MLNNWNKRYYGNETGQDKNEIEQERKPEPLTIKETRKIMLNAMLAGLTVGVIFIGLGALFILFCVYVWFR